jgi:hypothetical protein
MIDDRERSGRQPLGDPGHAQMGNFAYRGAPDGAGPDDDDTQPLPVWVPLDDPEAE